MRGRSLILPALALCCWLALAAPPAHAWRDSAGSVCSASPGDLSELTRSRHGAGGGNAGGGFSVSAVAAAAAAAAGGGFAVTVQGSGSYLGIVVTAKDATGTPIGTFSSLPPGLSIKTDCPGSRGAVVQHNSASSKPLPLTMVWSGAGATTDGTVTFEAVVLTSMRSWGVASGATVDFVGVGGGSGVSVSPGTGTGTAVEVPTTGTSVAQPTGTSSGATDGTRPARRPGHHDDDDEDEDEHEDDDEDDDEDEDDDDGESSGSMGSGSDSTSSSTGTTNTNTESTGSHTGSGSAEGGHNKPSSSSAGDGDDGDSGRGKSSGSSSSDDTSKSSGSSSDDDTSGTITSSSQSNSQTSNPNPAVIGGAVAASLVCLSAVGLGAFLLRRNRRRRKTHEAAMEQATNLSPTAAAGLGETPYIHLSEDIYPSYAAPSYGAPAPAPAAPVAPPPKAGVSYLADD